VVWSPGVYHNLRLASSRDVKSAKLLLPKFSIVYFYLTLSLPSGILTNR